jgi:hypothetical protein
MTDFRFATGSALLVGLLLPLTSTSAHPGERCGHRPEPKAQDTAGIDIPGVLLAHDAMEGLCGRRERSFHRPVLERSTDTGTGLEIPGCEPGDTLEFQVVSQDSAWYASTARVAPLFRGRSLKLLVDGHEMTGSVPIPDGHRPRWIDLRLPAVKIPAGRHNLRVVFPEGGVKFRFLALEYAVPGKPAALRAPKPWWPLALGWTDGGTTASFQVLRSFLSAYDTTGTTSDTTFVDRPSFDSARFRPQVSYVVAARNGSLTTLSDTFDLPVIPAGTSLPPIGPVGGWTPQGFLLRWDAVAGASSYGVQGRLGTATPGGYGGVTDTTFFLDPQAVPGVIYRVFPYGDANYYGAPLVGGSVLVPPRP